MALTLHQSDRIEYLADVLAILAAQPPADIFAPEEILIATAGLRRFVDLSMAQHLGVAANIRYDSVPAFFWRIMFACLPDMPQENVYAPAILRWRILETLVRGDVAEAQAVLQGYLKAHTTAAYELAQQLAELFDQYLVYRPQWTEAWSRGELLALGADEAWQAALWRHLQTGINSPHRVALWHELRTFLAHETLSSRVRLPERVFVFGISTLAPVYPGLLEALAKHCDVHVLALNPCAQYWGDVLSAAQCLRLSASGMITHPLLASLGKQGRDFFDLLGELNPLGGQVLSPPADMQATLLHRLQDDIRHLRQPSTTGAEDDGSIILTSTYSALRELQVVKDAILDFLDTHPQYSPDDIAVLSPNIEEYAPFIEAVFGRSAADALPLPYSIADTKISRGEPFLQAWEMLLALFESRFEITAVLPLLDNECILNRFDLNREDVPLMQSVLRETCVHWAWDEEERQREGGRDAVFTWSQALDRIMAGLLLPETEKMWLALAPYEAEIELLPVLSRFAAFLETLFQAREAWRQDATGQEWAERIRQIGATLLEADNSSAATTFIARTEAWQNECIHAGLTLNLSAATINEHLRTWLNAPAENGFLRNGVTFGSMIPLRNLPFAFLALIGMNDGAFPRAARHTPFDLMNTHPQKGDRSRRDDDRYLFLESLMSAREVLYLSYVGRDIRHNEPLAPSELIEELSDTLANMTGEKGHYRSKHVCEHPLQPFSPKYFSGCLKTYRSDYADALNAPRTDTPPFWNGHEDFNIRPPNTIDLADFLSFWRNPPRFWLQRTLSWSQRYQADTWESSEPFTVKDKATVNSAYLNARRTHADFNQSDALLHAQSRYPAACLGKIESDYYRNGVLTMNNTYFTATPLAEQVFSLDCGRITITGSLNTLYDSGQIFFRSTPPNAPQQITDYLLHLIACAVSDKPVSTMIACPRAEAVLPPLGQTEAHTLLLAWGDAYLLGQNRPLPFFAKTSLAAARVLHKQNDEEKAFQAARSVWFGNDRTPGQCHYSEVKAVFSRDEQSPLEHPLFRELIHTLLLPMMTITTENPVG